MSYTVPEQIRRRLLKYGSFITGAPLAANAIAVTAASTPILTWLEESADDAEFERRCAALERQYSNAAAARWEGKTEEFLDQARVLRDWAATEADVEVFTRPPVPSSAP